MARLVIVLILLTTMEIWYYLKQWLLFNCCIMRKSKGYYIFT